MAALDDARLSLEEVDGLWTNGLARFSVSSIAGHLGILPTWTDSTFAGGVSCEVFVGHTVEAIKSGRCGVAVISYASDQRSAQSRQIGGATDPGDPEARFEAPYGPLSPLPMYALAARRHTHEFGTTSEQVAEAAVAAREWVLLKPKALRYDAGPLSIEQVLASPMTSSPLHALGCCLITGGGGTTHMSISQMPDLNATGASVSSARAFAIGQPGPDDADVGEVSDSFTITVLLTLEALGFCQRGEAGALVSEGRICPGGDFPLTYGGRPLL
jgi:acetyl-CoA acetyltransferase